MTTDTPSPKYSFIKNLVLLPLAIPALIMAIVALVDTYHSQRVKFWASHEAVVDSVSIGHSQKFKSHSIGVKLNYSYEIDGRKYSSDEIAYGYMSSNFISEQRAIYKVLKDAHTIKVYVDPNDPSQSVIATGFNVFILMFYIPLFVVSVIYYFNVIRKKLVPKILAFVVLGIFLLLSGRKISTEIMVLKKRNPELVK